MFKKIFASLAFLSAAAVAEADVMYWQVTAADPKIEYDYAILKAVDTAGEGTELYVIDESGKRLSTVVDQDSASAGVWSELPEGYKENSYLIELYSYDVDTGSSTVVGQSGDGDKPFTYDQIKDFVKTSPSSQISQAWTPGFTAVPEPTGALLVILGVGLLALKRRTI